LTQLTQLTTTPLSSLPPGLTNLAAPSFHTLTAVNNHRNYPLVPAPIQARDIPSIKQEYLEERHIQLYQPFTTFPQASVVTVIKNDYDHLKNGLHHSNYQTVIKNESIEYDHMKNELNHSNFQTAIKTEAMEYDDLKNGLHHTNFQNPMIDNGLNSNQQQQQHQQHQHQQQHNTNTSNNQHQQKNVLSTTTIIKNEPLVVPPPTTGRNDTRKKERRKIRASSLESSAESESSAMEIGGDGVNTTVPTGNSCSSGQVAAISSTANFKSPMHSMSMGEDGNDSIIGGKKQVFVFKKSTVI
jgi:hypothetical protein